MRWFLFKFLFYFSAVLGIGFLAFYFDSFTLWMMTGMLISDGVDMIFDQKIEKNIKNKFNNNLIEIYQISFRVKFIIQLGLYLSILLIGIFLVQIYGASSYQSTIAYPFLYGFIIFFLTDHIIPYKKWCAITKDEIVIGHNKFFYKIDKIIPLNAIEFTEKLAWNLFANTRLHLKSGERIDVEIGKEKLI